MMGTYVAVAPCARANARMPFTELWLSNVSRNRSPGPNGYDSPISLSARLALPANTTSHSSGDALKKRRIARRARATHSVATDDEGLVECGLPHRCVLRNSKCRAI